jgi:hypothetical protein
LLEIEQEVPVDLKSRFESFLSLGSRSDSVKRLQARLNELKAASTPFSVLLMSSPTLTVDGAFGKNTDLATRYQLLVVATTVRRFLEPAWAEWHMATGEIPDVLSRWTCVRSSLFLQRVLHDDCNVLAKLRNGTPRLSPKGAELGPFGFLSDKKWQSHAWISVGDWIVDVTADQFGASSIIVTARSDPRYCEGGVDTAPPEARSARERAVECLWPLWVGTHVRSVMMAEFGKMQTSDIK